MRLHPKTLLLLSLGLTACTVDSDLPESDETPDGPSDDDGSAEHVDAAESAPIQYAAHLADEAVAGESTFVRGVVLDNRGKAHVRLAQTFDGIEVFGAEALVHLHEDGSLWRVTDDTVRGIDIDTEPNLRAEEAAEIAVGDTGGYARLSEDPEVDLQILRHRRRDHLVYRVQLRQFEPGFAPAMPVVFVDAHDGEVVDSYDNLQHIELNQSEAVTYDANETTDVTTKNVADSSDEVAEEAHTHVLESLSFLSDVLGRDSYDDEGKKVQSFVHYDAEWNNASWNGREMKFGDGDGDTFSPLVSLDIVAHELGHAVTGKTAKLVYRGESGALNEATSDIFAAATEWYVEGAIDDDTWRIGEDCYTPGESGDALRTMNDPAEGDDPEHYSERHTGSEDNGGVHTNSSIGNLFFYLLSEGGDNPNEDYRTNTVDGIGIEDATRIWYTALSQEMTRKTNYAGARRATERACATLFGASSSKCDSVTDAWREVGVGELAWAKRFIDFNDDGYSDLAVGAPGEDGSDGAVGVLYGSEDGLSSNDQFFKQGSNSVHGSPEDGDLFGRSLAAGDFNGDGNTDLLVGAPGEALGSKTNAGIVNALYGGDTMLQSTGEYWTQNVAQVAEAQDRFAHAMAVGDFDNDGFDDVAIGAPGENSGAGSVTILYGTKDGLNSDRSWEFGQNNTNTAAAEEAGDLFGTSLAVGDFDGDGCDDLAIGAPGEALGSLDEAGLVIVLFGETGHGLSGSGSQLWHQNSDGIKGEAEADDRFGHALAAGDFDGDGHDDLAVGTPGENDGAGYVNVLLGSSGGLTDAYDQLLRQDGPLTGAGEDNDHFGVSLTAADFDRDGYEDLVIGVPGEDFDFPIVAPGMGNGAGALHVVFGSSPGLDIDREEFWYQDADIQDAYPENGDHFGHTLTMGDYDGDSYPDLAVGSIGEDDASGLVIILYGDDDGLSTTGEQLWDQDTDGIKDSCQDGDLFGFALR